MYNLEIAKRYEDDNHIVEIGYDEVSDNPMLDWSFIGKLALFNDRYDLVNETGYRMRGLYEDDFKRLQEEIVNYDDEVEFIIPLDFIDVGGGDTEIVLGYEVNSLTCGFGLFYEEDREDLEMIREEGESLSEIAELVLKERLAIYNQWRNGFVYTLMVFEKEYEENHRLKNKEVLESVGGIYVDIDSEEEMKDLLECYTNFSKEKIENLLFNEEWN